LLTINTGEQKAKMQNCISSYEAKSLDLDYKSFSSAHLLSRCPSEHITIETTYRGPHAACQLVILGAEHYTLPF
jgi:hypothetical protein